MQEIFQKHTDNAVSKTINLPHETTDKDLSNLLLEYVHDLKGVTVYRDGSRGGQILNKITEEEVKDYLSKQKSFSSNMVADDVKCASGSCEL